MKKVVVSKQPKDYLTQGPTHCGAYATKAIVEAYGKSCKKDPRDLHTFWLNRVLGTGLWLDYWPDIIKSYGLNAEIKNADNLSDTERLQLLKDLLSTDNPVMIHIRNGYTADGRYSNLRGRFVPHWITVWGYDDTEKAFYVYDSAIPKKLYDKDIPIGNKKRTYDQMLRDWNSPIFIRIPLPKLFGYPKHLYVTISDKNKL